MKSMNQMVSFSNLKKLGVLAVVLGIALGGAGCRKTVRVGMQHEDAKKHLGIGTLLKFSESGEEGSLTDLIQSLQNTYGAIVQTVNITLPRVDLEPEGLYFSARSDIKYTTRVGAYETVILNLVNGAQAIEVPFFGQYESEICKSTAKKAGSNCAKILAAKLPAIVDAFSTAFTDEVKRSLALNVALKKSNGEMITVSLPVKDYAMDCDVNDDHVYNTLLNFKRKRARVRNTANIEEYSLLRINRYFSCSAVATF